MKISKELKIRKGDVDFSFKFESIEELQKQLKEFPAIYELTSTKLSNEIIGKRELPKKLEGLCEISNNYVVLNKNRNLHCIQLF